MVGEVFAGLSALKTAFDVSQGLQKIHDAVARDRAVIELQKEILIAQAAQQALIERVRTLEAEIADFKTWESEKQRYELKDIGEGPLLTCCSQRHAAPNHRIGFVQHATQRARKRFCSQ
jgi:hypothetical protein